MKTVAIIPARGGSKGIPRKNIRLIAGKPLIAWSIEAALSSSLLDRVIVSTDDEEIAEIARSFGADVPFLRPAEMARDETPTLDTVLHALEQGIDCEAVLLLQPTSPLRSTTDIDSCLSLAELHGYPSVVSVCEPDTHPDWTYLAKPDLTLERYSSRSVATRRQDLPPVIALNGALYYSLTRWLKLHGSFVTSQTRAYSMPRERSIDIDSPLDWRIAEMLLMEKNPG